MTWSMRTSWGKLLSNFMLPSAPPTRKYARRWTLTVSCAPFKTYVIARTHSYPALLWIFSRSQKLRTWWTELSAACQSPASKCVWLLSGMTSPPAKLKLVFMGFLLLWCLWDRCGNGVRRLHHLACMSVNLAQLGTRLFTWRCTCVSLYVHTIIHTVRPVCLHKCMYLCMSACVHIYTYAYLLISHTQQLELHSKNKYSLLCPFDFEKKRRKKVTNFSFTVNTCEYF